MTEEKKSIFDSVKDGVVGAIRGVGDVAEAVVDTVSGTLVSALKGVRAITDEALGLIFDTVSGAVKGVAEVGGDVGIASKNAVLGVIRGTKEVATGSTEAISASAEAAVKAVGDVGGDVASAAKGAVEGAIEGAKEIGLKAEDAAAAAASGAVKGAGKVSTTAVEQVRNVVTGHHLRCEGCPARALQGRRREEVAHGFSEVMLVASARAHRVLVTKGDKATDMGEEARNRAAQSRHQRTPMICSTTAMALSRIPTDWAQSVIPGASSLGNRSITTTWVVERKLSGMGSSARAGLPPTVISFKRSAGALTGTSILGLTK